MSQLTQISLVFTAGLVGGLVNSLAVWFFGKAKINQALGVQIAPELTKTWLYPRLVWGGLWGLGFLIPLSTDNLLAQAFIISLLPTLYQSFVVFPKAGKGTAGLKLGALTPLLVIFFNFVWGVAAVYWIHCATHP